jgi:CheY-like chemotaxis protein
MDGRDVLANIKTDVRLRTIPIIVLTISDRPEDIEKCYQLHANCYIIKPSQLDEFEKLVMIINEFWLKNVKIPRLARHTKSE